MAKKPVWEGHLRLSLVTCPVALFKATDPQGGVSFHLINPKTNSRITTVAKDPTTGRELDRKTLVKGYEVKKDSYVLIDPEELKALRIESTHILDIERFVAADSIDRIYWDEPYYLGPADKTGIEAFAVILQAMRAKERVGIGRLVLSTRERMCALEPRGNRLLLTTLRTHGDMVEEADAGANTKLPKADKNMLEIAEKIIDQQQGDFDPTTFKDRYEDAVRDLIKRKQKGHKPTEAPEPERGESNVVDLMDALRRSLAGGKASKASKPKATSKLKAKRKRAA